MLANFNAAGSTSSAQVVTEYQDPAIPKDLAKAALSGVSGAANMAMLPLGPGEGGAERALEKVAEEAAEGIPSAVSKIVNSEMPHAAERAVERAGFSTVQDARAALQEFAKNIEAAGKLPEGTIADTANPDRVIVPGFGQGGAVVYQIMKNGSLRLKTVLIWIPPGG